MAASPPPPTTTRGTVDRDCLIDAIFDGMEADDAAMVAFITASADAANTKPLDNTGGESGAEDMSGDTAAGATGATGGGGGGGECMVCTSPSARQMIIDTAMKAIGVMPEDISATMNWVACQEFMHPHAEGGVWQQAVAVVKAEEKRTMSPSPPKLAKSALPVPTLCTEWTRLEWAWFFDRAVATRRLVAVVDSLDDACQVTLNEDDDECGILEQPSNLNHGVGTQEFIRFVADGLVRKCMVLVTCRNAWIDQPETSKRVASFSSHWTVQRLSWMQQRCIVQVFLRRELRLAKVTEVRLVITRTRVCARTHTTYNTNANTHALPHHTGGGRCKVERKQE